jgi:hypothetical protein
MYANLCRCIDLMKVNQNIYVLATQRCTMAVPLSLFAHLFVLGVKRSLGIVPSVRSVIPYVNAPGIRKVCRSTCCMRVKYLFRFKSSYFELFNLDFSILIRFTVVFPHGKCLSVISFGFGANSVQKRGFLII